MITQTKRKGNILATLLIRFSEDITIYQISKISGISESTLGNWKKSLTRDPDWRPWKTHHGIGHRIFTDIEEAAIKEYITNCFLKPGYIFTNEDFVDIALNAYLTKHPEEINVDETKQFMASHHFISDFEKRNHLSSRVLHAKRRFNITENEIQK